MIQYTETELIIRELGNGVWTVICFCMAASLLYWGGRRFMWRAYKQGRSEPAICASFALSLYFIGSGTRALAQWGTIMSAAMGWDSTPWTAVWPLFVISLTCAVIGAVWCVWTFAPTKWRYKAPLFVTVASITVPLLVYFGVRYAF